MTATPTKPAFKTQLDADLASPQRPNNKKALIAAAWLSLGNEPHSPRAKKAIEAYEAFSKTWSRKTIAHINAEFCLPEALAGHDAVTEPVPPVPPVQPVPSVPSAPVAAMVPPADLSPVEEVEASALTKGQKRSAIAHAKRIDYLKKTFDKNRERIFAASVEVYSFINQLGIDELANHQIVEANGKSYSLICENWNYTVQRVSQYLGIERVLLTNYNDETD